MLSRGCFSRGVNSQLLKWGRDGYTKAVRIILRHTLHLAEKKAFRKLTADQQDGLTEALQALLLDKDALCAPFWFQRHRYASTWKLPSFSSMHQNLSKGEK